MKKVRMFQSVKLHFLPGLCAQFRHVLAIHRVIKTWVHQQRVYKTQIGSSVKEASGSLHWVDFLTVCSTTLVHRLAVKTMSDSVNVNGSSSDVGSVEKPVLSAGRFTCGEVRDNKKLTHLGDLSGFPELSCCSGTAHSSFHDKAWGAFHRQLEKFFYQGKSFCDHQTLAFLFWNLILLRLGDVRVHTG